MVSLKTLSSEALDSPRGIRRLLNFFKEKKVNVYRKLRQKDQKLDARHKPGGKSICCANMSLVSSTYIKS